MDGNESRSGKPLKQLKGTCKYCCIQGHRVVDCHKKKAMKKNDDKMNTATSTSNINANVNNDTKYC